MLPVLPKGKILPELWEIAGGSKRLAPEQIKQNRLEFLKKFLPEEYEKEIKKRQGQNDEDLPNMRS